MHAGAAQGRSTRPAASIPQFFLYFEDYDWSVRLECAHAVRLPAGDARRPPRRPRGAQGHAAHRLVRAQRVPVLQQARLAMDLTPAAAGPADGVVVVTGAADSSVARCARISARRRPAAPWTRPGHARMTRPGERRWLPSAILRRRLRQRLRPRWKAPAPSCIWPDARIASARATRRPRSRTRRPTRTRLRASQPRRWMPVCCDSCSRARSRSTAKRRRRDIPGAPTIRSRHRTRMHAARSKPSACWPRRARALR